MPGGRHQWHHHFRANVCRWTAPRESILDLLSRATGHLSAKEIYLALGPSFPGLGLTTVYRTLEILQRLGMVRRTTAGDGQGRYELQSGRETDHHHHLICTSCGKIIDYRDFLDEEMELVKKTEQALMKKHDFVIQDHNIEFLGLCGPCRRAGTNKH